MSRTPVPAVRPDQSQGVVDVVEGIAGVSEQGEVGRIFARTGGTAEVRDLAAFALGYTWPYLLAAFAILLGVTAYQLATAQRHYLEWESLQIDD